MSENQEPMSTQELVNREQGNGHTGAMFTANGSGDQQRQAIFPGQETEGFRSRWHQVQGTFVDEPRQAVEQADQLVASVVKRLAEVFADERNRMEHEWSQGQDVSTEDLRQALRRYRSFFDRLLSV
jgi:hypothetical protein